MHGGYTVRWPGRDVPAYKRIVRPSKSWRVKRVWVCFVENVGEQLESTGNSGVSHVQTCRPMLLFTDVMCHVTSFRSLASGVDDRCRSSSCQSTRPWRAILTGRHDYSVRPSLTDGRRVPILVLWSAWSEDVAGRSKYDKAVASMDVVSGTSKKTTALCGDMICD